MHTSDSMHAYARIGRPAMHDVQIWLHCTVPACCVLVRTALFVYSYIYMAVLVRLKVCMQCSTKRVPVQCKWIRVHIRSKLTCRCDHVARAAGPISILRLDRVSRNGLASCYVYTTVHFCISRTVACPGACQKHSGQGESCRMTAFASWSLPFQVVSTQDSKWECSWLSASIRNGLVMETNDLCRCGAVTCVKSVVVSLRVSGSGKRSELTKSFVVKKLCGQLSVADARLSVLVTEHAEEPFSVHIGKSVNDANPQRCSPDDAIALTLGDIIDTYEKPLYLSYLVAAPAGAPVQPQVSAFDRMMAASKQQCWPDVPSRGINGKLDLQFDIVAWLKGVGIGWRTEQLESHGVPFVSLLSELLWYLDPHSETLKGRAWRLCCAGALSSIPWVQQAREAWPHSTEIVPKHAARIEGQARAVQSTTLDAEGISEGTVQCRDGTCWKTGKVLHLLGRTREDHFYQSPGACS